MFWFNDRKRPKAEVPDLGLNVRKRVHSGRAHLVIKFLMLPGRSYCSRGLSGWKFTQHSTAIAFLLVSCGSLPRYTDIMLPAIESVRGIMVMKYATSKVVGFVSVGSIVWNIGLRYEEDLSRCGSDKSIRSLLRDEPSRRGANYGRTQARVPM